MIRKIQHISNTLAPIEHVSSTLATHKILEPCSMAGMPAMTAGRARILMPVVPIAYQVACCPLPLSMWPFDVCNTTSATRNIFKLLKYSTREIEHPTLPLSKTVFDFLGGVAGRRWEDDRLHGGRRGWKKNEKKDKKNAKKNLPTFFVNLLSGFCLVSTTRDCYDSREWVLGFGFWVCFYDKTMPSLALLRDNRIPLRGWAR